MRDGDTLRGAPSGSTLRASAEFKGRAMVVLGSDATVERVTIDGNRAKLARPMPIAPYDRAFADFYRTTESSASGTHEHHHSKCEAEKHCKLRGNRERGEERQRSSASTVSDSGSLNDKAATTRPGAFFSRKEQRSSSCRTACFENVHGNGIWTHSRNVLGTGMAESQATDSSTIGRDAIQVGHATEVRVDHQYRLAHRISHEMVDMEGGGCRSRSTLREMCDKSVYEENEFHGNQRQVHRPRWLPPWRRAWQHMYETSLPRSIPTAISGSYSTTRIPTCSLKRFA